MNGNLFGNVLRRSDSTPLDVALPLTFERPIVLEPSQDAAMCVTCRRHKPVCCAPRFVIQAGEVVPILPQCVDCCTHLRGVA